MFDWGLEVVAGELGREGAFDFTQIVGYSS